MNKVQVMELILGFVDNTLKDVAVFFEHDEADGAYLLEYREVLEQYLNTHNVKYEEYYGNICEGMLNIALHDYDFYMINLSGTFKFYMY